MFGNGKLTLEGQIERYGEHAFTEARCMKCGKKHMITLGELRGAGGDDNYTCKQCMHEDELPAERAQRWREMCPAAFQGEGETTVTHPDWPVAAWGQVMNWSPKRGEKGILLVGDTGAAKSRIIWMLLRRIMVQEGLEDIEVLYGAAFRAGIVKAYADGRSEAFVHRLATCRLLVFDDLGLDKLGSGTLADFRSVLDERYRAQLPILAATNFRAESLEKQLVKDQKNTQDGIVAATAVQRLRLMCDVVPVKKQKKEGAE